MSAESPNSLPRTQSPSSSAANPTPTGEAVPLAAPADATAGSNGATRMRFRDRERYRILGEHGRGGLGRVARAQDLDLGREIAIKEMISRTQVNEARFLREAVITARLQHPGIVPLYEAGYWPDGTPFYTMKLVAGRSLRELILERNTVEQRIGLLHHVIAVADAIAFAHDRNVIHRDLKPANVIVGDFGETIVIDWGLAKDLSARDEPAPAEGPRLAAVHGLTEAGNVVGTPTYMAPEQERGEHVDQRADVFAIGAMLWELCSLHKVPPSDIHLRHRFLRRAGIDRDLVIILDKALDPDPRDRYPDAGSLAADLKAFKSGARIGARRYSLLAMLGHWIRRHRPLVAGVVVAMGALIAGSISYVRSIASERDRAEASSNRLLLKNAELMLRSDPTAAFDLLNAYSGRDRNAVEMLRAQVRGLGMSSLMARPHSFWVLFARALPDGSLVTLAGDGTVVKTSRDGTGRVIAQALSAPYAFDYLDHRNLLAYGCDASVICLLDIQAEVAHPMPIGGAPGILPAPIALAFSPSGDLLAAISADGKTSVWELSTRASASTRYQTTMIGARSLSFVDENTLAVQTVDRVSVIHLDARPAAFVAEVHVRGGNSMDSSARNHVVAVGTADGALIIIDSRSNSIVRQQFICKGHVNKVLVVPTRSTVAYACQDGDSGIWDFEQGELTAVARLEGGAINLAGSTDGRNLLFGGILGKLVAYDFTTQMASSYLGHEFQLSALLAPSPEFPHIVSGDTSGAVRTWSPPEAVVSVAIKTTAVMYKAIPLANNGPVISFGASPTIHWYMHDGAAGAVEGHDPSRLAIALSPVKSQFAMYGSDDEVEIWSFEPRATRHTVKVGHGRVTAAVFTADGAHLVTGSRDGAIIEWSNDGNTHRELWRLQEPVTGVRAVPGTGNLVIADASNALWLGSARGIVPLGREAMRIASAVCSYDSKWLAAGTDQGVVRLYNLSTGQVDTILRTDTLIANLTFSPDSTTLAIMTRNKVFLHALPATATEQVSITPSIPWQVLELSVPVVAWSPDNTWIALMSAHGDLWFYRRGDNRWVYRSIGNGRVSFGKFSDNGAYFVASDTNGRALLVDMRASIFIE